LQGSYILHSAMCLRNLQGGKEFRVFGADTKSTRTKQKILLWKRESGWHTDDCVDLV